MKKINLKTWLISKLRRINVYWPYRSEALKKARIERGLYKCNMCQSSYSRSEIVLDHVIPVIDIKEGFTTWDDYIPRLFCETDNFQVLCKKCHTIKCDIENKMRKKNKKELKNKRK